MLSFDSALGIHQDALHLRGQRMSLLAANIANTDTPGFQARDIDFREVLAGQRAVAARPGVRYYSDALFADAGLPTRQSSMTSAGAAPFDAMSAAQYRIPMQPSLDGNTVEADVEMGQYAENALRYQASLRFISGRLSGLRNAITGSTQ